MKRCPTEAIRVRGGKSYIISARCIDCGECIRICQHRARKVNADEFDVLDGYRWKIALPAPSFYGQFEGVKDINPILTALKLIGFDDVFEVSRAAELVSDLTRRAIKDLRSKVDGPVISSACPAVVRLIRVRYPQLCDHVLPLNEPMVIASRIARAEAAKKTGLKPEEIGTFFITPCPAKVTAAKAPLGIDDTGVSGVLPASKVYTKVLSVLRKAIEQPENLSNSGRIGVSWAMGGGETAALNSKNTLRAHSIENVIKVLDELENEKIKFNIIDGGK